MEPCRRCIRMEEQIVRAHVRRFPHIEYADMEQSLAMLLGEPVTENSKPAVPEEAKQAE